MDGCVERWGWRGVEVGDGDGWRGEWRGRAGGRGGAGVEEELGERGGRRRWRGGGVGEEDGWRSVEAGWEEVVEGWGWWKRRRGVEVDGRV